MDKKDFCNFLGFYDELARAINNYIDHNKDQLKLNRWVWVTLG